VLHINRPPPLLCSFLFLIFSSSLSCTPSAPGSCFLTRPSDYFGGSFSLRRPIPGTLPAGPSHYPLFRLVSSSLFSSHLPLLLIRVVPLHRPEYLVLIALLFPPLIFSSFYAESSLVKSGTPLSSCVPLYVPPFLSTPSLPSRPLPPTHELSRPSLHVLSPIPRRYKPLDRLFFPLLVYMVRPRSSTHTPTLLQGSILFFFIPQISFFHCCAYSLSCSRPVLFILLSILSLPLLPHRRPLFFIFG